MWDTINKILDSIGSKLVEVILSICETIKKFFSYKEKKLDKTIKEETIKEKKKIEKSIEDIVDNGTIDDLLDIKRKNK